MGLSVAKSGGGKGLGGADGFITRRNAQLVTNAENITPPFVYQPAEVFDVDLTDTNANLIGRIKFRFYNDAGKTLSSLDWAYPLISNIRTYPLLHETVLIFDVYGRYYYLNSINASNYINNNSLTGVTSAVKVNQEKNNVQQYQSTQSDGIPLHESDAIEEDGGTGLGDYFENENTNVPILLPNEGDTIIQGRFGNCIRFTSSEQSSKPSIKISLIDRREDTYKSVIENLDEHNCIWITSDDNLIFTKMGIPIDSRNEPVNEYSGNQVIISSGRIIFNTKENEILMFSNTKINFACNQNFGIDSGKSMLLNSQNNSEITSKGGQIILRSAKETIFQAPNIYLGDTRNAQHMVKGDTLYQLLDKLVTAILSQIYQNGAGPTGPPLNSADFVQIQRQLKSMLSNRNYTV